MFPDDNISYELDVAIKLGIKQPIQRLGLHLTLWCLGSLLLKTEKLELGMRYYSKSIKQVYLKNLFRIAIH
jgi:hypothetical protein